MTDSIRLPVSPRFVFELKVFLHRFDSVEEPGIYTKAKSVLSDSAMADVTDLTRTFDGS